MLRLLINARHMNYRTGFRHKTHINIKTSLILNQLQMITIITSFFFQHTSRSEWARRSGPQNGYTVVRGGAAPVHRPIPNNFIFLTVISKMNLKRENKQRAQCSKFRTASGSNSTLKRLDKQEFVRLRLVAEASTFSVRAFGFNCRAPWMDKSRCVYAVLGAPCRERPEC